VRIRSIIWILAAATIGCSTQVSRTTSAANLPAEAVYSELRGPTDVPTDEEVLAELTRIFAANPFRCGVPREYFIESQPKQWRWVSYSEMTVIHASAVAWKIEYPIPDLNGDSVELNEALFAARVRHPNASVEFSVLLSVVATRRIDEKNRTWRHCCAIYDLGIHGEVLDCVFPGGYPEDFPSLYWMGFPSDWVTPRTRLAGFDEAAWLRYFEELPRFALPLGE
jgi:hypothetical protein